MENTSKPVELWATVIEPLELSREMAAPEGLVDAESPIEILTPQ